jgi:hypothetical protein
MQPAGSIRGPVNLGAAVERAAERAVLHSDDATWHGAHCYAGGVRAVIRSLTQ